METQNMTSLQLAAAVRTYASTSPDRNWSRIAGWSDTTLINTIGRSWTVAGALKLVSQALGREANAVESEVRFSVVEKFEMLADISEMVMTGRNKAMVVCGGGGTGKTFTLLEVLKRLGLKEIEMSAEDAEVEDEVAQARLADCSDSYIKVTGSVSAMGLYKLLFHHSNGGKLVFDDCDAVFNSTSAIDILKGVLDTSGDGTVSWHSPSIENAGLPSSFTFTGKVIFITNKKIASLPQPILSRGLIINMDLTKQEIVDRARMLNEHLLPHISAEQRAELFDFVEENLSRISNVTLRLFTLASPFIESGRTNWKKLLLFTNPTA